MMDMDRTACYRAISTRDARFDGRLFNSAGDGFMLEFSTVSGALEAAEELAAKFSVASLGVRVDVTDETAVAAAVARTVEALGAIDHLVHAAAIGSGKFGFPFTNLTPADWPRAVSAMSMRAAPRRASS